MTWSLVVPGQPPSVNHSYKPVMIRRKDGRTHLGIAKEKDVSDWQTVAAQIARTRKPSGWRPAGTWIRVRYRFFLRRSVDCDNAMKALNDALALAIGVNDERFVPCVVSKHVSTSEKYPRIEIEIEDLPESSSLSPA